MEYIFGHVNSVYSLAEFDRRARELYLTQRGEDKYSHDSLFSRLDSQFLPVAHFRRILRMEMGPKDLVIKVRYPGGFSDTFDWQMCHTLQESPTTQVAIADGRAHSLIFKDQEWQTERTIF